MTQLHRLEEARVLRVTWDRIHGTFDVEHTEGCGLLTMTPIELIELATELIVLASDKELC